MFGRYKFTKAAYDGNYLTLRSSVVSGQKAVSFIEAFPALTADISALFEEKIYLLTKCRAVPDALYAIVVNTICRLAAARTFVNFARKFYVYFKLSFTFLNIFMITSSNPSSFVILSFIEHTSFLSGCV